MTRYSLRVIEHTLRTPASNSLNLRLIISTAMLHVIPFGIHLPKWAIFTKLNDALFTSCNRTHIKNTCFEFLEFTPDNLYRNASCNTIWHSSAKMGHFHKIELHAIHFV